MVLLLVFGGEPSAYAREYFHKPERQPSDMVLDGAAARQRSPVLAVQSAAGPRLRASGICSHVFERWFEKLARRPDRKEDPLASFLAVGLGTAGLVVAWAMYSGTYAPCSSGPRPARAARAELDFDELYDWFFYRPTVALATTLRDYVERPVFLGSIDALATGARRIGNEVTELQTGLVRTYALAIAGSVTVLALVFVWVK